METLRHLPKVKLHIGDRGALWGLAREACSVSLAADANHQEL